MTKIESTKFKEIKLAMKAGHYSSLTKKEKLIYKNAFKNGYRLAKFHISKTKQEFKPRKIIAHSYSVPKDKVYLIIDKVCQRYQVSKKDLFSKIRTQDVVRVRNIIHNLLSEKYNMNLSNIGRFFGQDHTTVLHSLRMKHNKQRFWDGEQTIWQEFQELKEIL
jgi:chromosomal replication initiation ATPase DnaA